MVRIVSIFAIALSLSAAPRAAGSDRKDLQVFNDIAGAVTGYTRFTIFDDIAASVHDGVVTLTGKVTISTPRRASARANSTMNGLRCPAPAPCARINSGRG